MKKIPTLFERIFEPRGKRSKIVGIRDKITPGCEEAFFKGMPTVKYDGSCCMIKNGVLYKRYDAKAGKKPPEGAIPCCDPDPITGHWPHWVMVDPDNSADKWFVRAYQQRILRYGDTHTPDGTYEAVGEHFQGNPYKLDYDILWQHGTHLIDPYEVGETLESVRSWLEKNNQEGLVFWYEGEPVCKIKRTDFGLEWPVKAEVK